MLSEAYVVEVRSLQTVAAGLLWEQTRPLCALLFHMALMIRSF